MAVPARRLGFLCGGGCLARGDGFVAMGARFPPVRGLDGGFLQEETVAARTVGGFPVSPFPRLVGVLFRSAPPAPAPPFVATTAARKIAARI